MFRIGDAMRGRASMSDPEGVTRYGDFLKESQDRIEKIDSRDQKVLGLLVITAASLLWGLVDRWAVISPMYEDLLRVVGYLTMFALAFEVMMFAGGPSVGRFVGRTEAKISPATMRALFLNAVVRVIILRALYVATVGLLWPHLGPVVGGFLLVIFGAELVLSIPPLTMPKDEFEKLAREQLAKLRQVKPFGAVVRLLIPLLLFSGTAWGFLLSGRAILSLQLALLIGAILFIGFFASVFVIRLFIWHRLLTVLTTVRAGIAEGRFATLENIKEVLTRAGVRDLSERSL